MKQRPLIPTYKDLLDFSDVPTENFLVLLKAIQRYPQISKEFEKKGYLKRPRAARLEL